MRGPFNAAWLVLAVVCGSAQAAASLYELRGSWTDEHGSSLALAAWRGRPAIVAMEYSECRFICSTYWLRLMQVQREADRRGLDIDFVILSIDPDHDTPAAWRAYRQARDLQRRNWHFLTAGRVPTDQAAALLGVRWWYAEGHLMHDFRIVRLDPAGRIVAALNDYAAPVELLLAAP